VRMINHRRKPCRPNSIIDGQAYPELKNQCSKVTRIVWRVIRSDSVWRI